MIDLGQSVFHDEGVLVFADHADHSRYYYLPDVPRVVTDDSGAPQLKLLEYHYDDPALLKALGGGMLAFSVDLGVDADRLKRIAGKIQTQQSIDKAQLGPVIADSASCQLVMIDTTKRTLGTATPSLYGDNQTTFMAVLAAPDVAIVDSAIKTTGGLPIGVVYSLNVLALRPAIRATIVAHWDQVYNFYENRLHGGKLLLAVDIGETVNQLIHSEAISVTVDDLIPADQQPPVLQAAVDEMQRYVVQQFFQPVLSDAPPPDGGAASDSPLATIGNTIKDIAGLFSFTYSLRSIDKSELKTFTFNLQGASAESITLSPQGALSLAIKGLDPTKFITLAQPVPNPQMDFDVGAAIDLAADSIDHLEVRLTYGANTQTLTIDPTTPHKPCTFWYDAATGPTLAVAWDVFFTPGAQGPGDTVHGPASTTQDRVIRIDPRLAYQEVALTLMCVGVPFDKYPQVIADVEADDPTSGWSLTQTFTLDATHAEMTWTVRAALSGAPRFRRKLRYVAPDGTETPVDWDTVAPGVAIIPNPHPDLLDVQVLGSARFGTAVSKLIVELRPAGHPEQTATRVLTADAPTATWSVAAGAPSTVSPPPPVYEYRVTVFTTHSEVQQGQWLGASDGTLIVGEGIARLRAISLVFVGKTAQQLGLISAKLRFHFADATANLDAEDELLVADFTKPVSWSYPVADPSREAYDWTLSLIHNDGTIETRPAVTTSDLLVVVPLV